ncbi:MAG: hypothetical protein JWP87_939 [Labilithrix sp.]|nr:hypothetical protein [Labilithrix sp.]
MTLAKSLLLLVSTCGVIAFGGACGVDTAPDGLRRTPAGDGPMVKFDVAHRPLPEVPLPNDLATFADPTSRTGRRINVSLVAPTFMERNAREDFTSMEGWGISSPISVAFDRAAGADPREAAIDLEDVASRMQGDEHDLSNDPFYIVNLTTGLPVFVDVGNGYYPVTLRDPFRYFPNDPKAGESNLAFETVEEGLGLPQSAYRPDLDNDFDGVLDHPNTLGTKGIAGVDNLLTWYERETDTLIMRPVVPLDEKTEYAVVLTDRLRGGNRQPIRSPFESIHHPSQRKGIARLADVLREKRLANYFGDIAGTGLDHVAFAWTFTTQPTHEDMRLLRDGLYGTGPFARFATEYPAVFDVKQSAGQRPAGEPQDLSSEVCQKRAGFGQSPYVVKVNDPDIKDSFHTFFKEVFGLDAGDLIAVEKGFENIDYIVVGTYKTPYLMGDPASRDPDTRFHVDFRTGQGDVRPDTVQWFLSVPKKDPHKAPKPAPVAFWGHGVTGHSDEILFYAGDYAKQGIAMFGYNNPEHGLVFDETDEALATSKLFGNCLVPFLDAFKNGRAHDLNGDGKPDSGWFWWTAHIFHTRDNVRQGILDGMQALRILRTFGQPGTIDYNNDGKIDPVGDFNGDGTPDVGGPDVPYFAAGESLGGIMSGIQGGIDPYVVASAPMSGGGSLALDVGFRSYGVVEAVTAQLMGPLVFAVPPSERPDDDKKSIHQMGSRCAMTQRSVRIVVNEGDDNHELEIACLNPDELGERMTVVVENVNNGEVRCARTEKDGRFRVPIPSSTNDRLDIQIYNAADVVQSYDGCKLLDGDIPIGRRISTWEQPALHTLDVAAPDTNHCDEPLGCTQFRDVFYPVGSALVAPNEGFGFRRQSPSLRRFRDLAQAAFDPADPIAYAPYYMLKPLLDPDGNRVAPHALLNINTVGDNFVQIASGVTFARAAGAVPFLPPSAAARYPEYADYATPDELYERLGRRTPMQFLVDQSVVEGVARLGKTTAGPACKANYKPDATTCTKTVTIDPMECKNALYDADWVSEGGLPYDQPHPDVPLRLARVAKLHVSDSSTLAAAWEPRLRGVPFAPDETAWSASERVVGLLNHYLVPKGQHTWDVGDACKAWDFATYGNALTARFFATEGRDVYYLSHPKTHGCLAIGSCDFMKP